MLVIVIVNVEVGRENDFFSFPISSFVGPFGSAYVYVYVHWENKARQGRAGEGKEGQGKERQFKERQGKAGQDREGKCRAGQGKARKGRARKGRRQDTRLN